MERISFDCTPAQLNAFIAAAALLTTGSAPIAGTVSACQAIANLLKPYASVAAGGTGTNRALFDTDTNH